LDSEELGWGVIEDDSRGVLACCVSDDLARDALSSLDERVDVVRLAVPAWSKVDAVGAEL
jgi:hypothetical protein